MSGEPDPPPVDFERVSSQLDEGLKSCRSVVRNYRAMLDGGHEADQSEDTPATDTPVRDTPATPPSPAD